MSDSNRAGGSGLGLCSILFLVFLVLKLCGQIDWSWWWVTAPLWIPTAVIITLVLLFIGAAIWREADRSEKDS